MTELVNPILRWLYLGSGVLLLGTFVFFRLAGPGDHPAVRRWREQVLAWTPWLAALMLVTGVGLLAMKSAELTGWPEHVYNITAWSGVLFNTRFGAVWLIRTALMLALFVLLVLRRPLSRALGEGVVEWDALLLSAAALAVRAFAGHGAGMEPAWPAISLHIVHLLGAGAWFGGLPALILLLFAGTRNDGIGDFVFRAITRFSASAGLVMLVLIVSGVVAAILQIEKFPALLGTPYGQLILAKVLLLIPILAIAAHVRLRMMPRLQPSVTTQSDVMFAAGVWVTLECAFGTLLVGVASVVGDTAPAIHQDIVWLFPFRFSLEATWDEPFAPLRVYTGLALTVISVAWFALRKRLQRTPLRPFAISTQRAAWVTGIMVTAGLAVALPAIAIDAYPDTYRRTTVPYHAISIANGAQVFSIHCVSCHGVSGVGNGPVAKSLPVPPADLTEPHTALHTAGDLYWWLTHGKPPGVMPGFEAETTEEERWDLINFLRTLSNGYQARLIRPRIAPNKPWLGAPDFNYVTPLGVSGALKDYRERKAVLLVFLPWPEAQARFEQLRAAYGKFQAWGAEVLIVPMGAEVGDDALLRTAPFPVAAQEREEIVRTYNLLSRTLAASDRVESQGSRHMEFLIDRFGYIRARWIAGDDDGDWMDLEGLGAQMVRLRGEKQILPPPDEHVH